MKTAHRNQQILRFCREKFVLDLGCAGHDKFDKHMARDHWLHEQIRGVAKSVVGVDLDEQGVAFLRERGYDVLVGDLERLAELPDPGPIDVILAADVIEHVSNPGLFLDGAHRFFGPDTCMVLTTPNAFYWRNFVYTWQRRERVRTDHMCWYSHNTLQQLLERHGYRVEDDLFSLLRPRDFPIRSGKTLRRRLLYRRTLRFSKTLIYRVASERVHASAARGAETGASGSGPPQ
jgi:SAM-dependent methyltransferase